MTSVVYPVTGVDACAGGWVAVTLHRPTVAIPQPPDRSIVTVTVTVAPTLAALSLAGVVGIDMPLGLLADGWRAADSLARRALGRRGVTVFAIPPRPVWQQPTYADANRACRELTGKGLAAQTWGLRAKLLEADAHRRASSAQLLETRPEESVPDRRRSPDPLDREHPERADSRHHHPPAARLYEVHPELAFAAMAGAPLTASKHTEAGLATRRQLLANVGITLPAKVAGAAGDDLLDAAAVAWSARRIAAGRAVTLTDPTQRADDGAEIAIRY